MANLPPPFSVPAGWEWKPLRAVSERVSVGYVGPTSDFFCAPGEGVLLVRSQNIRPGRLDVSDAAWVTRDFNDRNPKSQLRPGDILITRVGANAGDVCRVPDDAGELHLSSAVFARPRLGFSRYVELWLRSPIGQQLLLSTIVGSVSERINTRDADTIPVPVPPSNELSAIASTLGALDDKIELNRRMNEALEAMARAIFQDWFVAFGPTRAKMEGRPPYLAPDLWTLFPDRLDADGEPEGWREVPLDQVADFLNGLALQKYPGTGHEDLPVIKIAELRAGSASGSDRASRAIPPQYVVEDGDVLFSWSGSLLQRVWTGGRGALNQHLFKVTSREWPKWLHYLWVDHHLPQFQAIAASKATTMGHIQRRHLSEAMTVIGSPEVMKAADELIAPLFQRSLANSLEARTLAATRDLLLPRLMSGELRLNDAECMLEPAA